ncbi:MAG: HU family DNA-binding protein [Phycisphaerales bacterium]
MGKKNGKASGKAAKAAPKPAKITGSAKVRTKSEIYSTIAEHVGLPRKQVAQAFDVLGQLIAADLKGKAGVFAIPGLMKVTVVHKPATKGGMRPNPFKPGEMMEVKPKPARKVVKVRPLRALKAMV